MRDNLPVIKPSETYLKQKKLVARYYTEKPPLEFESFEYSEIIPSKKKVVSLGIGSKFVSPMVDACTSAA